MSDPTPAEIETGATALNGPLVRYGAVQQGYRRTVAEAVLRAVLPGHDTRLRGHCPSCECPDVPYDGPPPVRRLVIAPEGGEQDD